MRTAGRSSASREWTRSTPRRSSATLEGPLAAGVVGRARSRGLVDVRVHDLRDYADPPHRSVDDAPYGGGAGMLFRAAPLARAVEALRTQGSRSAIVLPSPRGELL